MKPFGYAAPETVPEAVALLASAGDTVRPLAGGTDLLVQLRRGDRRAEQVVDVKRIPELREIRLDSEGLVLGAAVTCAEIAERADVAERYPCLVDAVSLIGGTAIQGRATVGGNLCNAAPSADSVPALMVLKAECRVAGPRGERRVPVGDVCTGPGLTVLEPGELLVSLVLPPPASSAGGAYLRFIPRGEMDIAVVGAASWLRMEGNRIAEARVALASVAPTPLAVPEAARALEGREPTAEVFAEAGRAAAAACRPISDMRGSIAQRRHLASVLVRRTLELAAKRAGRQT